MPSEFARILEALESRGGVSWPEPATAPRVSPATLAVSFLRALGSDLESREHLLDARGDPRWGRVAGFYFDGLDVVRDELEVTRRTNPGAIDALDRLAVIFETDRLSEADVSERFWEAFFPEAAGIRGHEAQRENELRNRRRINVATRPANPIDDAGRQVLLTTNILLTLPREDTTTQLPEDVIQAVKAARAEPQVNWYDHPIPIGTPDEANEILHGLAALDEAVSFEKRRGVIDTTVRMPVLVSVSATHDRLRSAGRAYVQNVIESHGGLRQLVVYPLTEDTTSSLIEEVVLEAARRYLDSEASGVGKVFGVDGSYGRHYSFLKAVAALWSVLVDPDVAATFKFDLDQVFPQEALVEETGRSAFENMAHPLWGASGLDDQGGMVDLGMIAGSLVNERDIGRSLFAPDVTYPQERPAVDELVFWSVIPQALSTAAEMGRSYDAGVRPSTWTIERVHVTGGTTGIRVDALRRHRPFTPTFISRAEDQAYLMGTYLASSPRLACAHADGLVMRHDKETFAGAAIEAAKIGKLIGDYERAILFSGYARALDAGTASLKNHLDPYTGCFISPFPATVTYLRFALRTIRFFHEGSVRDGEAFALEGARRIGAALRFTASGELADTVIEEQRAWDTFYDTLDALEVAIAAGDRFALHLRERARRIFEEIAIERG